MDGMTVITALSKFSADAAGAFHKADAKPIERCPRAAIQNADFVFRLKDQNRDQKNERVLRIIINFVLSSSLFRDDMSFRREG